MTKAKTRPETAENQWEAPALDGDDDPDSLAGDLTSPDHSLTLEHNADQDGEG